MEKISIIKYHFQIYVLPQADDGVELLPEAAVWEVHPEGWRPLAALRSVDFFASRTNLQVIELGQIQILR